MSSSEPNINAMWFYKPSSRFLFIIIALMILFPTLSHSQSYNRSSSFKSHWSFDVNAGTSLFFGDIKQYQIAPVSNYENEWRFGAGTILGMQISPIFGVRGQFLYGQLAGTRRAWNMYFESNYIEFNLHTTIGIRNIFQKYNSKQFWNAYIIFGLGLTNYNTEVKDLQTKKVLRKVGYGSGSGISGRTLDGFFIGGLGVDLRLSNRVHVNLESANRILNSDMLDGRVSGFKYDVYNYTSVGLSYKFGGNTIRPPKEKEEYSYFRTTSKKKDQNIDTFDYDYNLTEPVSPPEIDLLTITPVLIEPPKEEPAEIKIVKQPTVPVQVETIPPAEPVRPKYTPELEYRVQIRAKYGNKISMQLLSNQYGIPLADIKENSHNGFYIYTVGSFSTYDEARDKRNYIRSNNGISDAFVVAFRNGVRLNKLT